jgi:hypothetical protein
MSKLIVLLVSMMLMRYVASNENIWDYHSYYFIAATFFFIIMAISAIAAWLINSILLWGYALLNYTGLLLFSLMVNVKYFTLLSYVVYDNHISFSLILNIYELLLLCSGFFDAFVFLFLMWSDADHGCYSIKNMFKSYHR